MAFMNCFFNFNINFARPGFGFNFGCFSMPNFFSNMPVFSFNSFSSTPFFNQYGNFTNLGTPSLFGSMPNYTLPSANNHSLFNNYCWNNSWQGNFATPCFDTFSSSITVGTGERKKGTIKPVKYVYSSERDKYSSTNIVHIQGLSTEMQQKTKQLIAFANSKGYDIKITSGNRTETEQQALIAKDEANGTHFAAKKNSPHLSGIAIDIQVFKNGKKLTNNSTEIVNYAKNTLGMRWGGDFVNWTKEPWHFDLRKA